MLALVFIMVTAEMLIYPSQNNVQAGIFSFSAGQFNLRLADVLVLSLGALAATRIPARPKLVGYYYVILCLSLVYISIAASIGLSSGASLAAVYTQSRFLLYLLCLAPVSLVISPEGVCRAGAIALKCMAAPIAISGMMTYAHLGPSTIPGFPGSSFGAAGGDIGTLVGVLALCQIGVRAAEGRASWAAIWLFFPLLIAQRASILTTTLLGLTAAILIWQRAGIFGARGKRRIPPAVAVSICSIIAFFGMVLLVGGTLPLVEAAFDSIVGTFTSEGKLASADTRPMQLNYAWNLFLQQPLYGHGLGQGVQFFDIYAGKFVASDSAHNFIADVLIRGGIIGTILAFLLFASALSHSSQWTSSRLVSVSVLAILLGKGLLEPAFDKYRLVIFVAIAVTTLVSARYQNAASFKPRASLPLGELTTDGGNFHGESTQTSPPPGVGLVSVEFHDKNLVAGRTADTAGTDKGTQFRE